MNLNASRHLGFPFRARLRRLLTTPLLAFIVPALILLLSPAAANAGGDVTFTDLAQDPDSGLAYQRTPSASSDILDDFKAQSPVTTADLLDTPLKSRGAPGVALADFDGDGDLDIYVTNGPGTANSLFASNLAQTGELTFNDVGAASGAGATDQDSTGVCFGDVDNDGDPDLYVLGNAEPNRFFENQGDGTFIDFTASAGLGAGDLTATSCSFGDVNGDGLLDLVVANSWDWLTARGIFLAFTVDQPNQLFVNQGGNIFADVSESSGIRDNAGFPPEFDGAPGLTWAIAIVDLDLDGDADVLMADDQGAVPLEFEGGVDRGIFHFFENDGTGHFTDVTVEKGLAAAGGWMALDFGDFNCDGRLDFFASNFSDLAGFAQTGGFGQVGVFPSRWYLADADGGYTAPDLGSLLTTPFGWGSGVLDYDADGDHDIIYQGGMDLILIVEAGNAGTVLQNQGCSASFVRDTTALAGSVDHRRRNVQGMAVGDLNDDGFEDLVSVSSFDSTAPIPLLPIPNNPTTDFQDAVFVPTFAPGPGPGEFTFTGIVFDDGSLSVELNSGNHNRSIQVETIGTVGLVSGSRAPRDGIGAVVQVIPRGRHAPAPSMAPIVGGSSYASQHSLVATFGMGRARRAVVDVLWPGGVRNRVYGVRAGQRVEVPEIPCSYDDGSLTRREYIECVRGALSELVDADVIQRRDRARLFLSAIRAWNDFH